MDQPTKKAQVVLLNGEEAEVLIYRALNARIAMQIQSKLLSGVKIKPKSGVEDIEIDGSVVANMTIDIAEAIWADKNISIDDVEGGSLQKLVLDNLDCFLGGLNLQRQA